MQVWWKGDNDIEYFSLRCRTEEQLKQWETALNKLIVNRRPSHVDGHPPSASATQTSYSAQQVGYPGSQPRSRYPSQTASQFGGEFPVSPGTPNLYPSSLTYNAGLGLISRERADSHATDDATDEEGNYFNNSEKGYESPYSMEGRATPSGSRRPHASMPAQRVAPMGRAPMARGMSAGSDGSFVSGSSTVGPNSRLRSQFSSTRLRGAYDEQQQRTPMMPAISQTQQQHLRMRSASTPTAYNPAGKDQPPPPPIPIQPSNASVTSWTASTITNSETKRGSGSSQSTNASSDYSAAQTTSPVTPYGSNDSTLATLRPMRSQGFAGEDQLNFSPPVKVKVHFREDLFVIVVQRSIDYQELMEKVGKKIRLCGAKHDFNSPFRVRYKDEDGDMISLASNDDLQIALDSSQVVLFVV